MLNTSPVSTTARRTPCRTAALQQHQSVTCRGWVLPARLPQGRLARRSSSRPVVCAAAQRHPGSQAPTNKLQPPTAVATSAAAPTAEPPTPKQLLEEPSAPSLTAAAGTGGSSSSEAPGSSSADASSLLASVASASTASQPRLSRRPSLQDIQAATSDKLAQLQVVVAEPGAASSTQQLSEVLHQLEVLEANLSEALQQHQEEEQAAAAAAAAAVTTTAPSSAPPAAAPHVPGEGDAYVVVDDPLAPLAGSQLPLAGAFDPQLKAGAPPTVPSVAVMAGALPATSAAAAAAAAETTTAAAAALELQVQPGQHQGAPHVSPALEAAAFAELEAAAEAVTMGATGEWDESDVMTAAAAGAASSADTTPITTVSGTAAGDSGAIDSTKLWALFVLGLSYVHQATTGFALPALLPMISPSLHLDDFQGALLTSGYSYLYAAALVPVGLLADRVKRPQLLAVGLLLWSSLSIVASGARSFSDLLLTRIGFAAAQATQNPVSFSLIPDLFPANKSTALAGYNCAIYLGRALSFASVLAAHRLADSSAAAAGGLEGAPPGADIGLSMVPLDRLDLQRMSILYTTGDMAAVTPVYNYNFNVIAYEGAAALGGSDGWRELLTYIGYPGFVIAALMMLSVREPRDEKQQQEQAALASRSGSSSATASLATLSSSSSLSSMEEELAMAALAPSGGASSSSTAAATGPLEAWRQGATNLSQKLPLDVVNRLLRQGAIVARRTSAALRNATKGGSSSSSSSSGAALAAPGSPPAAGVSSVQKLIRMPAFQTTTLAAALNDVGSYALIAWHSTFYERVYHLDSSVYAPMLAIILPVGGILGGLGGGLIGDYLSVVGGRQWLTAGASVMAAPFIMQSLLAENSSSSFLALLVGFALSEAWRAPSAIMIRNIAPQELGSTASALYLCIRNMVGGLGPVAVAKLAEVVGLQHAMLLAPSCYVMSGLLFLLAEKEIEEQTRKEREQLGLPPPQQQGSPAPVPEASN